MLQHKTFKVIEKSYIICATIKACCELFEKIIWFDPSYAAAAENWHFSLAYTAIYTMIIAGYVSEENKQG